ncbi:hypothetical protein C5167_039364 [Papaver somniferum]|uniref:Uncharacterized protein n=1 Tax=Papaver somniferum TaxID=3469 RepID=A0A4Y7IFF0_PAPSO|nr:hypothetical protein C5167_039364 [Papaver somniferum]
MVLRSREIESPKDVSASNWTQKYITREQIIDGETFISADQVMGHGNLSLKNEWIRKFPSENCSEFESELLERFSTLVKIPLLKSDVYVMSICELCPVHSPTFLKTPSIYVFDCSAAGMIFNEFIESLRLEDRVQQTLATNQLMKFQLSGQVNPDQPYMLAEQLNQVTKISTSTGHGNNSCIHRVQLTKKQRPQRADICLLMMRLMSSPMLLHCELLALANTRLHYELSRLELSRCPQCLDNSEIAFAVPRNGHKGGLSVLWISSLKINVLVANQSLIHAYVEPVSNSPPWLFIGIYGPPQPQARWNFW